MLVRMRSCPRINAPEIGYAWAPDKYYFESVIPDPCGLLWKKKFRFEYKEKKERKKWFKQFRRETIEIEVSSRSSFSHDQT